MLLVDVGNTNTKIYKNAEIKVVSTKEVKFPKEKFYYICVNSSKAEELKSLPQAIDLEPHIALKSSYRGLGVDRKVVCKAIDDGVVVDAGSAITVDVVEQGVHKGGFITLGLSAFRQSFANISDRLEFELDSSVDINRVPQSTHEALNFATFFSVVSSIEKFAKDKKLYICGGDALVLKEFFKDAFVVEDLLFKGMKRVIKESGC